MKQKKLTKVFIKHAQRNLIKGLGKWIKSCEDVEGWWGGDRERERQTRNIKSENLVNLLKLIFVLRLNHLSALT